MSEFIVCFLRGEPLMSTRCQRCELPLWDDDSGKPQFCADCREWFKRPPHPQRGKKRGPRV